jgi:hypothetical protein
MHLYGNCVPAEPGRAQQTPASVGWDQTQGSRQPPCSATRSSASAGPHVPAA